MNDHLPLLNDQNFTPGSFLRNIFNHFLYGDDAFSGIVNNNSSSSRAFFNSFLQQPVLSFPFECHPGPLSEAIIDSINISKTLFLFIYSRDNIDTHNAIEVFRLPSIQDIIQQHFLFYAVEATTIEGWRIANSFFKFKAIPIIALIRPRGTTLSQSQILWKHEGLITESQFISYLSIDNHFQQQTPNTNSTDTSIVQHQNEEFQRAVEEARQNQRSTEELEQLARESEEIRLKKLNDDYNAIPVPQPGEDMIVIKFLFPDNVSRTREFIHNATINMLFAFVRKFEDIQPFELILNYPMRVINESNELVSTICPDKHFVIHVEETD